jgi:RNA polymerase primary sigma factor
MFNGNYISVLGQNRPVRRGRASRIAIGSVVKQGLRRLRTRSIPKRLGESKSLDRAKRPALKPVHHNERSSFPECPSSEFRLAAAFGSRTEVSRIKGPSESDSILSLYMREAGEVPLITPEQEVELAARIRRGDEAAREHMVRANLRFVIKIAREYENLGMPLLDLINEGNIGLMKAVEKFDPAKGGKLSTYAVLWIKQQIRRALASQGKTIRLPIHVADKIYQLTQAEVRLRHQLGREATDEELADELDIKSDRLAKLRRAALRPSSLDAPLGEDCNSTVAEVVADENARSPFEQLRDQMETGMVRQLVNQLSEREARIIRFRFGLDGGEERTLEDVGRKFNLTRERIRQLQNLALQKLRQMLEESPSVPLAA